jgi:hypothetical protein
MSPTNPVSPVGPVASPPPPGPVATTPVLRTSRRSSGRWLNALLIFAAAVAIGGVAFAAGRTTATASTTGAGAGTGRFGAGTGQFPNASGRPGFVNGGPNGQGFGRFAGALTLDGTVESIDGTTLTLKTANGDTIKVTLGSDTTYATQTPATASDVTTGSKVQVRLDPTGINRQGQGGSTTSPLGTAGSVTVVP